MPSRHTRACGYPVRWASRFNHHCPLEYWVARSRLRQGFDEQASRAMTTECWRARTQPQPHDLATGSLEVYKKLRPTKRRRSVALAGTEGTTLTTSCTGIGCTKVLLVPTRRSSMVCPTFIGAVSVDASIFPAMARKAQQVLPSNI